ncbi:tetratricopeptide repeat protein [Rapidithrix thailandica]|uniref:Tetratricopeptide repeat protein n=1 Tax=Rapidithrix thailandica TaxID=413964 RepID=A0AAW9S8F5_9BACT
MQGNRRLAAIMFTDMVGYSALSQKDEALALELLDEHRLLLRPFFEKHEGREIETAGDSFFVEFNSAVEAVQCAIEIQSALYQRNNKVDKERRILLRIGLHIGDVVISQQHVHGDGVNIAARMEPLAAPGGICISEDVARQIRNKVPFPVIKLGRGKLKNISLPIHIYCIQLPWQKQNPHLPQKTSVRHLFLNIGLALLALFLAFLLFRSHQLENKTTYSKTRLAVLPLTNISYDSQNEYFADGMTEELISSLSKIGELRVIARSSVMKYKGGQKDIAQIGKELMVGTILEGSVRKFENKARITVQLIDVSTQEHLWSMDYDRELKDIFHIQSEIAQNVAKELKVRLIATEKELLSKIHTDNINAYQDYLVGKYYMNTRTSESIHSAIRHFELAINQDPQFALPYAHLAYCYTLAGVAGYGEISREEAEKKAWNAVNTALQLDSTLAEAHAALAYIQFRIDWDWISADREFRKAISLNPSYATAHEWYALFLSIHTRLDEALVEIQKAYELDPLSLSVNTGYGRVYHFRNELDKAITQLEKTLTLDPGYAEAYFALGMTYYKDHQPEKALPAMQKAVKLSGRRPVMLGLMGLVYLQKGDTTMALQLLSELETPPMNSDQLYACAFIKMGLGREHEAFDIYDQLVKEKYGVLIYMNAEQNLFKKSNRLHPRFQKLLDQIGFQK